MTFYRSFLEVDLSAVRHNINCIMSALPSRRLMAVVKADAYGAGVKEISASADECGCCSFGVATCQEAVELRSFGITKPICMLSGVFDDEIAEAINSNIVMPLTNIRTARKISSEALRRNKTAKCNIIIDTGMGRVGFLPDCAETQIKEISTLPGIEIVGIYSHFSSAGAPGDEYTLNQISLFKKFLQKTELPVSCKDIHFAAFDAINNYSEAVCEPFNMARCGIGMYGMADKATLNLPLKPALKFAAKVVEVRMLPAGSSIGYMHTAKLQKPSRIAVVAAGYADGLPLEASNRARFLINGRSVQVIGRISMDYTTCDLGDVPCNPGDDAVIFGSSENESICVSEVAALRRSHDYDVLCSVGSRSERRYIR